jgi:hypothetical protein
MSQTNTELEESFYDYVWAILTIASDGAISEDMARKMGIFEDAVENKIFDPLFKRMTKQFPNTRTDLGVKAIVSTCTSSKLTVITPKKNGPHMALFESLSYPCNCVVCGSQKNGIPYDKADLFIPGKHHISEPEPVMDVEEGWWACRKHAHQLLVIYAAAHFVELFKRGMGSHQVSSIDEALGPVFGKKNKAGKLAKPMAKWKVSDEKTTPPVVKCICEFRNQLRYMKQIVDLPEEEEEEK